MEKALDAALVWFRRDLRSGSTTRRSSTRLQAARAGLVRLRLRPRDPRPRCRAPTAASSSSVKRWSTLDAELAALGHQHGGRCAPDRAPRRRPRRDRASGARAARAGRLRQPRRRPDALARDASVRGALADRGVALHTSKDHVVFERSEILTRQRQAVQRLHALPDARGWPRLDDFYLRPYPVRRYADGLAAAARQASRAECRRSRARLREDAISRRSKVHGGSAAADALLDDFLGASTPTTRRATIPAVKGPSYLGVHLRFGTISIRQARRRGAPAFGAGEPRCRRPGSPS